MTRLRAFTLIELMIVVAIVVIVMVVAVPSILEAAQTDNQQKAIQSLRTYSQRQHDFRGGAIKRIGQPPRVVFARPFAELYRYNDREVDMIPEKFAAAVDQHHAYNGYYFIDDPRITADSDSQFGLFAIPAQYQRTGQFVYYINEDGNIREYDAGAQITDPVSHFTGENHPRNANATGWEIAN